MADNYAFTPGSGATGAADDVGGVLYPRVDRGSDQHDAGCGACHVSTGDERWFPVD